MIFIHREWMEKNEWLKYLMNKWAVDSIAAIDAGLNRLSSIGRHSDFIFNQIAIVASFITAVKPVWCLKLSVGW